MRIFSWRLTLVVIAATALISYPKAARAMTVDVTIGPNFELVFSPSSVTIHQGDQVRWTWSSSGHSTTSGSPGQPNGIWDSGLRPQGAMFTHTFNSTGTFPYYCTPRDSQWLARSAWTDYECIFPVGTTTSYGSATPMQSQTGNTYRNITANINGLTPHTTYHFRMVATNAGGTRMGSDRTFTTP